MMVKNYLKKLKKLKDLKERFDEIIIKLTDETNFDDLILYFKNESVRKISDDSKNEIKLF